MASSAIAATEIAAYHLRPELFIALPATFIALSTIALAFRIHVRAVMLRTFGADDWLLLLAYAIFVGDCSLFIAMGRLELQQGLNGPLNTLSEYQLVGMLIYVINQIILKISVALFFLRILQQRYQRLIIIVSVSIYAAYEIALIFVALFQCGTPGATSILTSASCMPWDTVFGPINYIGGALNAIVDWIFVLTPIVTVYKTSLMPKRAMVSVCLLIGLGALGSVASVVRIPILGELGGDTLYYFGGIIPLVVASLTETGLGIICISLATLRPLLDRLMGNIVSTMTGHRSVPVTALPMDTRGGSRLPSRRMDFEHKSIRTSPFVDHSIDAESSEERHARLSVIPQEPASVFLGHGMGFDIEKGSETKIWTGV